MMQVSRTQVFVTSDWHLGGSLDASPSGDSVLGSNICRSIVPLTRFLRSLHGKVRSFDGDTELVLNGDIVDFLAPVADHSPYTPVAWQNDAAIICEQLDRIAARFVGPDGDGPFEALRALASNDCRIIILLGNHDVELCLPDVRPKLSELVGGNTRSVRFLYDGEAYTCGKLLVEHGNQYDPFNAVDFDQLRRERSQLSRGFGIEDKDRGRDFFQPPTGSSIVVDEINPKLSSVPFLNLLKPERDAAIPLMLAFYPETRGFFELMFLIGDIAKSASQNRKEKRPGLLTGEPMRHSDLNSFLKHLLGDDADPFLERPKRPGQLAGVIDSAKSRMSQLAEKAAVAMNLTCPWDSYRLWRASSEQERVERVKIALKRVRDATDFAEDVEEDRYLLPASDIIKAGGFQAVVFGHTHFPKEIAVEGGKYLNAGTWADVMRLPQAISSEDQNEAETTVESFLDDMRTQNYEPYIVRHRSYVRAVIEQDGSVEASLHRYEENGKNDE